MDAGFWSAVAALLAAIATGFAAIGAWRGPRDAARLAEEMRRAHGLENERRQQKLWILQTLMQERASLSSFDGVRALNLIDVVFHDVLAVREAWADLFLAFDPGHKIPPHARDERLRKLLQVMATHLGLGSALRTDDFGRIYYPTAIAEDEHLRNLERAERLRRFQQPKPEEANQAAPASNLFPPKPE